MQSAVIGFINTAHGLMVPVIGWVTAKRSTNATSKSSKSKRNHVLYRLYLSRHSHYPLKWICHFTLRVSNPQLSDEAVSIMDHGLLLGLFCECWTRAYTQTRARADVNNCQSVLTPLDSQKGLFFLELGRVWRRCRYGNGLWEFASPKLSRQHRCLTLKFPKSRHGSRLKCLNTVRYPCVRPLP